MLNTKKCAHKGTFLEFAGSRKDEGEDGVECWGAREHAGHYKHSLVGVFMVSEMRRDTLDTKTCPKIGHVLVFGMRGMGGDALYTKTRP